MPLSFPANLDISVCNCPVPCNEIRYTTEVHYSTFPDPGSAAALQADETTNVPFEYLRYCNLTSMNRYCFDSHELEALESLGTLNMIHI